MVPESVQRHTLWLPGIEISLSRRAVSVIRVGGLAALCVPGSWLLAEFFQLRGVVDLPASRVMLGGLWVVAFLMCAIITSQFFKRKVAMLAIDFVVPSILVFMLDGWAPKPGPLAGCYLVLEGVHNGVAMASINTTSNEPVDNVRMDITEVLATTEEKSGVTYRTGWDGTLDIGTCRAGVQLGIREKIPFDTTQSRLLYYVFILTRRETFIEKIALNEHVKGNQYLVRYSVYRGSDQRHAFFQYDSQLRIWQ